MRRVGSVHFERPVPILNTGRLQDQFDVGEHWVIETSDLGGSPWVRLHRPAVPEKNVPAVASFIVRGVGFCEPWTMSPLPEATRDEARATATTSDEGSEQAPVDAGAGSKNPNDPTAGSASAGATTARGRGPRKVRP